MLGIGEQLREGLERVRSELEGYSAARCIGVGSHEYKLTIRRPSSSERALGVFIVPVMGFSLTDEVLQLWGDQKILCNFPELFALVEVGGKLWWMDKIKPGETVIDGSAKMPDVVVLDFPLTRRRATLTPPFELCAVVKELIAPGWQHRRYQKNQKMESDDLEVAAGRLQLEIDTIVGSVWRVANRPENEHFEGKPTDWKKELAYGAAVWDAILGVKEKPKCQSAKSNDVAEAFAHAQRS